MFQGPWIFRGLMVLIEEFDGKCAPESVKLERISVWAQIHKIPDLYRKEPIVDQLARRIGIVRSVELNPTRYFEGNYIRVRASIDVSKPLIRWTPLNLAGERIFLEVKYEKIGYFCGVCGLLGHDKEECGDGVHPPDKIQWGKWLLAKRRTTQVHQEGERRFAYFRGSFRGRGRAGRGAPRKRNSNEAGLDDDGEERDTAQSPLKEKDIEQNRTNTDGTEDTNQVKEKNQTARKLDMDAGTEKEKEKCDGTEKNPAMAAAVSGLIPPPPPAYISPKERKKARNGSSPNKSSASDVQSAASLEEDRPAQ